MNKKNIMFIALILSVFFMPIMVKAYECSYKSEDGKTIAGYDKNNKVFIVKWAGSELNKSLDSLLNHSKNKYKTDKCYNYICIHRKKVKRKSGKSTRTTYEHSYYLGNSQEDFSSASECKILTKEGLTQSQSDKITNKKEIKLTGTLINTRKLNFDVEDKPGNNVVFSFYTYGDNTRGFCVNYDGQSNCSERFSVDGTGKVTSNIKDKNGNNITFEISGGSADYFFKNSSGSNRLDFIENGGTLSIGLNKINSGGESVKKDEIPQINKANNFICSESETITKNGTTRLTFKGLIRKYWGWVCILVPAALLVFISYDFVMAIISNDSDALKKSSNKAFKRTIAGLLILFVPWFVSLVMGWFGLTFCF